MTKEEGEIDDDESEGDDNAGEERGKRSDKDGRRKRSKHYDDEQYEGRREKRKRRKRDRSREKSKHKRSADRRREGDDDEDRDASFSGSDSEGLSVDRKDRRASPSVKESQSGVLPEARSRSRTSSGNTSEQAEVARKDREKEKRVAESLRAREEEVREHLSTIQKETQQKLGESKRSEALATYNSMLADLIRHTDYDYREARRKMKKDARYDDMADVLEPSEREKIFDEHIKSLKEKKRERFFELLKQVDVKLDTAWRDVKKLVKGDPRYEKFSSSERKAEKSVREYQKTLLRDAREDFKQLLRESKFIDHKSADKFTDEEYLCEIVEKLKMDKRYLELEPVGTETLSLLKEYAEELKRRGPPPPPTVPDANVSWRR